MTLRLNHASLHLQPPCLHLHGILQIHASRVSTRRKLKSYRTFPLRYHVRSSLSASFDDLFQNLISQFPSVNSLDLIAPALGLASGAALYLSHFKSPRNSEVSDVGEWILFTTPTPFNRFVLLRCPSIQFEGSELLHEVNDKLVKEDRHFVKLNSGRIHVPYSDGMQMLGRFEEKLVYQRVCVTTDDGGVISLDWPANLDMTEEPGLDTTLLLVPGTTEGSTDKNVRSFVCESLKQGCFPVVMNPRGCAGSPLTTPRLFTAADSDDVFTAIKFINGARPWTTLMGVGWGYGANMLTKYLAEVGERTPLTAAACIDNPFDLEEATRSSPYHLTIDQKLKAGLIDILSSNKELFQGRAKGFNVEKALSATSVRDFETAISMISYGFEAIEEFYATSSTRQLVGNVKIPVLFIQSDDGLVPVFSIPRSSIAENPFTSLLLCSCLPSTTRSDISALSWCQHLAIEWLTAVELGLLKGRHPLLNDVDVTINPSKGLALLESKASDKSRSKKNYLNPTHSDDLSRYSLGPMKDVIDRTNTAPRAHLRSGRDLERKSKFQDEGQQQLVNVFVSQQNNLINAESLNEDGDDPVDSERGQVLQTAEVVINMLDVTLPGTLAEDQKKKVLAAVEQGETVVKALQGAVPEDVRGKLTTAVSEIVQTQGTNLNLDRLMRIGRTSGVSRAKSNAHEKAGGPLSSENGSSGSNSSDLMKRVDELTTASDNNQSGMERPSGGIELELQPSSKSLKSIDIGQSQCVSAPVDIPNSGKKDTHEAEQNQEKDELLKERSVQFPEYEETSSETCDNHNHHNRYEKTSSTEEAHGKVTQGNGIAHMGVKEVNGNRTTEDESSNASVDQSRQIPSAKSEDASPFVTASPQPEPIENMGDDNQTNEEKNLQPMTDQNKQGYTKSEETSPSFVQAPNPPSLNVSQALDALTGLDDSTQMAVNSVFGVIEDMIIQLEEKDNRNDGKEDKIEDRVGDENEKPGSASEPSVTSEHKLEIEEDSENGMSSESNHLQSCEKPVDNSCEKCAEPPQDTRNGWDERKLTDNPSSLYKSSTGGFWGYFNGNNLYKEEKTRKEDLTRSKFLAENLDKSKPVHKFPPYVTINPYRDLLYSEYLNKYLLSKMSNTTSLDLDTTTDLLLDYIPEEGQWKLLDQPGNARNLGVDRKSQDIHSMPDVYDMDKIIEPSYVILDNEKEMQQIEDYGTVEDFNQKAQIVSDVSSEETTQFIKSIILDSLKVEVDRKLGASNVKAMESGLTQDLEQVANAVSLAIGRSEKLICSLDSKDPTSRKFGTLNGELIINTISSAVQDANYLGKVLPIGVIIGSSLAALRKHFNVATIDQADSMGEEYYGVGQMGNRHKPVEKKDQFSDMDGLTSRVEEKVQRVNIKNETMMVGHKPVEKKDQSSDMDGLTSRVEEKVQRVNIKNDTMMVGAVTAALGASALMVHQQRAPERSVEITEISSGSLNVRGGCEMEPDKLQEEISEKNQNNLVTCLAEKAMSVAGPVVPTKNDGEVDQERLVAMLADLGQKGGMLRLVGKIALLWGGIRGAMSLTDRLISFLRLAERPLVQRILGFVFMVLVLWSPVVVPLLPTLVQGWATRNSNGIAKYACIIGLYTAVLILIMLWGKRIRGYENPLEQYGLDLTSLQKLHDCLKGLTAGIMLVLSVHLVNALLGWTCFSWPSSLPSSLSDVIAWLKVCGGVFVLTGQGIMAAIGIAIAEELLFRSWLPEEIAVDLGYHQAIIISGLTFSILQRSTCAIPGLWLLSLALSGIQQRSSGSLSIPIGMRAGIIATNFILQKGGFLAYKGSGPLWLTGSHPFQPFSGAVGLAISLLLAIALYPQKPLQRKIMKAS